MSWCVACRLYAVSCYQTVDWHGEASPAGILRQSILQRHVADHEHDGCDLGESLTSPSTRRVIGNFRLRQCRLPRFTFLESSRPTLSHHDSGLRQEPRRSHFRQIPNESRASARLRRYIRRSECFPLVCFPDLYIPLPSRPSPSHLHQSLPRSLLSILLSSLRFHPA